MVALGAALGGCLGGLGVGAALVLLAPAAGPAEWGVHAVRLAFNVAGVIAVGLTLLPLLCGGARARQAAPALVAAHRGALVVGAVWTATAGLLLWLQVSAATGTSPLRVAIHRVGDYVGASVTGGALVVAGLCGLAVATGGALAGIRPGLVPPGLPAVPAVLGVLALPVTGHAARSPGHELAVVAVAVHVAAATAWVGGLGAVGWLAFPRRELLATTLPRYSRLATGCLVAVAVTGPLTVALRLWSGEFSSGGLPSTAELLGTPYGWILLGKSVGVVTLGVLGARARARLLPAVAARRPAKLTGWLTVELAVMGVVIGLASVLAGTPLPAS